MIQPRHLYDRVKKLRLKRGDVLVVKDPQDAYNLSQMRFPYVTFQIPIVCAPGGIEQLPLDALRAILKQSEQCSRIIMPNKIIGV